LWPITDGESVSKLIVVVIVVVSVVVGVVVVVVVVVEVVVVVVDVRVVVEAMKDARLDHEPRFVRFVSDPRLPLEMLLKRLPKLYPCKVRKQFSFDDLVSML